VTDNDGKFVLSAGIDAALHLVAELHGCAQAQETADHIEDDWRHGQDDASLIRHFA